MEPANSEQSDVLTAAELAAVLRVSRKFIEEHTAAGHVPGQMKLGRIWRYRRIDVMRAIARGGQFLVLPVEKQNNNDRG